jgi:hypothetical protein
LAEEILQVSRILAQEGAAKGGGQYIFQNYDADSALGQFQLTPDDTFALIGLLNSPDVDMARGQLGVLLGHLERPAVEGLTHRLFSALRLRSQEIAELEGKSLGSIDKVAVQSSSKYQRPPKRAVESSQERAASQGRPAPTGMEALLGNKGARAVQPHKPLSPSSSMYEKAVEAVGEVAEEVEELFGYGQKQDVQSTPSSRPLVSTRSKSEEQFSRPVPQTVPPGQHLLQANTRQPVPSRQTMLPQSPLEAQIRNVKAQLRPTQPQTDPLGRRDRGKREEMPSVFRRLTAPPCDLMDDQVTRAAIACTSMSGNPSSPGLSIGGIIQTDTGPRASAYLEDILQDREMKTGIPASSSRRVLLADDPTDPNCRSPRAPVTEEKAKEIFDRLYRSGKEHRVRRRVYHELGLLVEQAKEAQTCTFEPRVPLAAHPGGQQPEMPVTERLFRDSFAREDRRKQKLEAVILNGPTFRPQTTVPPASLGLPEGEFHDVTLDGMEGNGLDGIVQSPYGESPHERLFQESFKKKERHIKRQEDLAEWKKHKYTPDISRSVASGPQIIRMSSASGVPLSLLDGMGVDYPPAVIATASDEIGEVMQEDESGESALVLVFPEARVPIVNTFEEDLLNGLIMLGGAACISEVGLVLFDSDGVVMAELRGVHETLMILYDLGLHQLVVSGFRVGEVRWTESPNPLPEESRGVGDSSFQEVLDVEDVAGFEANAESMWPEPSEATDVFEAQPGLVYDNVAPGYVMPAASVDDVGQDTASGYAPLVKPPGSVTMPGQKLQAQMDQQFLMQSQYRGPSSQLEQQLSREASAATFTSVNTPGNPQRAYSGRLQGQSVDPTMVLTSGRGTSNVRYPPELASMPSSLTNNFSSQSPRYGAAPLASPSLVQRQSSAPQPIGTLTSAPALTPRTPGFANPGYGSYPVSSVYGGAPPFYSAPPLQQAPLQVMRAGY